MHSREIVHIITGLGDGGAEAVLYRLICRDGPVHHQVVSLGSKGKYGPLLEKAGARVICLNMPHGRVTLHGLWRLWRFLRSARPPVVQTWMYHADFLGGLIARFAGVPRVCWSIHNTTLQPGKSKRTTIWIAHLNAKLSHWVPSSIVCCGDNARKVHAALGYAAHKMVVVPNGYDFERFRPIEGARTRLRREWKIAEDEFVIGMVARFDPQKDHGTLLRALASLKEKGIPFACVLVGRGLVPENAPIAQLLASLRLERDVLLIGQREDIPEVMNAFDVHVLSSAYGEAFPNVLAEAMACGTPCVTTAVGDAADIVGETGWVVPPGDVGALASALEAAWEEWSSPDWRQRQEAARKRVVSHFGIDRMAAAYRVVWGV